jgi:TRAP-type C4-dicarboxylate transport system permease small subunit
MKILRWIDDNLELALASICIILIAVFIFAQIIMRNVLKTGLSWSDEASRYLFVWCGALGIPYATKKNVHLRMDIIPNLIPKLTNPLEILSDISLLLISIVFMKPGAELMNVLAKTNQLSAALRIPMSYMYFSMYFAFILSIIRLLEKYIIKIYQSFKDRREVTCK